MELKLRLFNAVYSGEITQVKNLLDSKPKSTIKTLVSEQLEGTTLLLIATRYDFYEIVEYLIDFCEADIEQVGKVEFDGETVHDTPPLWCAAAAGHFRCVKLLLERGANINSSTHTNSTPLRAACFDGHFKIVKLLVENGADIEIANKLGHTCLMISCFKRHYNIASYLIEQGCQINRQSVKGNTALHDCAESNSMDIIKLLVKNGATLKKDCFGLTPLMTASISGNSEIFLYLKSVFKCSVEDEADALKLLGATFVDKFHNGTEAMKYWKGAAALSNKCSKKYIESLINKEESFQKAYGETSEFTTETQLDRLLYEPDLMKIQSMMIRERILGIHHPETNYFVRFNGASYVETGNYSKCLAVWMHNLEQQQKSFQPFNEMTQTSFVAMIDLFSLMCGKKLPELKACDILNVLKMAVAEVLASCDITPKSPCRKFYGYSEKIVVKDERYSMFNGFQGLDRQFLIVLHLIGFMCRYRPNMVPEEWTEFKKLTRHFLSRDPRSTNSHSFLHVICILSSNNDLMSSSDILLYDVFKFIVDHSPDVNVVDINGNTALHYLFEHERIKPEMVSYLIQSGSHIDLANVDGLTPLDHLKNRPNLQNFRIKYLTLKCLCAQVIVKNNVKLSHVPKDLATFIADHQRKKFFLQS